MADCPHLRHPHVHTDCQWREPVVLLLMTRPLRRSCRRFGRVHKARWRGTLVRCWDPQLHLQLRGTLHLLSTTLPQSMRPLDT